MIFTIHNPLRHLMRVMTDSLRLVLPEILVGLTALAVLLADVWVKGNGLAGSWPGLAGAL